MGARLRAVGLAAVLAIVGGAACGGGSPDSIATGPTTTAPSPSTTATAGARSLGFSDKDNTRSTTVAVGQRITVILHSSDFLFATPSDPVVLGRDGPPTVTPGGASCVEVAGSGCGTVVANFVGLAPGDALLRAERPGCLEPECSPADARWVLFVHVDPPGASVPTTIALREEVPTTETTVGAEPVTSGEVRGTVRFSPVCPVERIPPDPACAPRPGPADVSLVRLDGTVAATAHAGDDGAFAIPVPPGRYTVEATAPGPGIGSGCLATPAEFTVDSSGSPVVIVDCDTGIR